MDRLPGRVVQVDGISRGTRAYRANAPIIDLTPAQWEETVSRYANRCVYCGRYCRNPTQDHLVPLSRGGPHTQNNVVPACGTCNNLKDRRTLEEFAACLGVFPTLPFSY